MRITPNLSGIKKNLENLLNLWKGIKPTENFSAERIPTPPEYDKLECWASHPLIKDKADLKPKGIEEEVITNKANLFFIHPTTYFGKENWNASLTHDQANELLDEIVLPGQVSIFNQCCETYVPRYRQATFYSFLSGSDNAKKALDLAYLDVKNAFKYFIEHLNKDKPFFIAGHSQGSLLGMRLLEEFIEGTELHDKFIAAYLPGYKIPENKFGRVFNQIKKGEKPNSIHCIISWDTFLKGSSIISQIDNSLTWASEKNGKSNWKKRIGIKCFGVNPLSFDSEVLACSHEENLGAVINEYQRDKDLKWSDVSGDEKIGLQTISLSGPKPRLVSAQLKDDGILYISKPEPSIWRIGVIPFGNFHVYDYNLFYINIRRNILLRWLTYQHKYSQL